MVCCRPLSRSPDVWPCCAHGAPKSVGNGSDAVPSVVESGMFVTRADKGYTRAGSARKRGTFRDCRSRPGSPPFRVATQTLSLPARRDTRSATAAQLAGWIDSG